jgi:hypothetical protein
VICLVIRFLIFIFLIFSCSSSFAAVADCDLVLAEKSKLLNSVRIQLLEDSRNPKQALEKLAISPDELIFKEILGSGRQGVVFLVERAGHLYALKLFRKHYAHDFIQATIIQKHLGDLEMAPKVFGVLGPIDIQSFLSRFEASIPDLSRNGDFAAGVLMEVTSPQFLKTSAASFADRVQVTPAQKARLLNQAQEYLANLNSLNIKAYDIDAVVDPSGRLLLVDFGFYKVKDPEHPDPNAWLRGGDNPKDVLFYIYAGTTTLRSRWQSFKSFFGIEPQSASSH